MLKLDCGKTTSFNVNVLVECVIALYRIILKHLGFNETLGDMVKNRINDNLNSVEIIYLCMHYYYVLGVSTKSRLDKNQNHQRVTSKKLQQMRTLITISLILKQNVTYLLFMNL